MITGNYPSLRAELARFARRPGARIRTSSKKAPTKWKPWEIANPDTGFPYGDDGAWELIATHLELGEDLAEITLDKPPGQKAYVMKIPRKPDQLSIYVKLQLGCGCVIARSFHLEDW